MQKCWSQVLHASPSLVVLEAIKLFLVVLACAHAEPNKNSSLVVLACPSSRLEPTTVVLGCPRTHPWLSLVVLGCRRSPPCVSLLGCPFKPSRTDDDDVDVVDVTSLSALDVVEVKLLGCSSWSCENLRSHFKLAGWVAPLLFCFLFVIM